MQATLTRSFFQRSAVDLQLQLRPLLGKHLGSSTASANSCLLPAAGLDFEAILLQPSNPPDKTQVPMVVMPHGKHPV